jgi:hypothetical protein
VSPIVLNLDGGDELTAAEFVARLDDLGYRPRRHSDYWLAFCPAHDDGQRPSLSVREGSDVSTLANCHAGCEFEAIRQVVDSGRRAPEAYLTAKLDGPFKIAATYPYTDERGELLFEVVRLDPKDFRQRKPKPGGGWDWRLGDARRVLYRLPEVVRQAQAGGRVYVAEGEKDADALRAAGVVATCPLGGAGKWRHVDPRSIEALRGADVVIVQDRDEPDPKTGKLAGQEHAAEVFDGLVGVARRLSIVQAREGKDAADHLAAGLDVGDLVVVRAADDPLAGALRHVVILDIDELLANEPEPPNWLWDGYVERGTLAVLHSDGGLGKSYLGLGLCRAMARGTPWLDHGVAEGRALYLDGENGPREIHRRLWNVGYRPGQRQLAYGRVDMPIMLDPLQAEPILTRLIEDARADFVVLDSQRGLWGGDEREALEVRPFYMVLARVAELLDVGILLLHHDNKLGIYSGSTDVNAAVVSRLHMERKDPKDRRDRRRVLWHPKSRSAPEQDEVVFELKMGSEGFGVVIHREDEPHDDTPIVRAGREATPANIAAWIKGQGGATPTTVRAVFSITKAGLERMHEALVPLGVLYVADGLTGRFEVGTD